MSGGSAHVDLPAGVDLVFYVDPVDGNDSSDGLSPQTAWKSWAQFVQKGRPGAALLLKRGCSYTLPLPIIGGAPGRPVVYGAYGRGKNPLLHAQITQLARPELWVNEGGAIWRSTTELGDVANVILDERPGHMRYTIDEMKNAGEWHQGDTGSGPIHLYSSENPASVWKSIEVIPAGNGIFLTGTQHSHIWIQDLHIHKVGTHGIQLSNGPTNVTIRRCEVSLCGGAVYRNDPFSASYGPQFVQRRVRFGNGIETWESVSDVTIEGCRIWEIFDGGICIQGYPKSVAQRVYVRDNVLWNCGYDSLDIAHGVLTRDVVFEYNTCVNAGEGWALQGEPKPRYSVNIPDYIGFHLNLENSFGWNADCQVVARHNIFYHAPESRCLNYGLGTPTPSIQVDHNCYFQGREEDAIAQLGKERFLAKDFAAYVEKSGWDKNSIVADPRFRDIEKADFRLAPDSPCAGMGARTSLVPFED